MIVRKSVKSNIEPIEIDDSRSDVIYVRSNIVKIKDIDPVFGTESIIYTYDEAEYTLPEWNRITNNILKKEIDNIYKIISDISNKLDNKE